MSMQRIADRIQIPVDIEAVLFDLDGVLLDTLVLDVAVVNKTLERALGRRVEVPFDVIKENFALAVPEYYRAILSSIGVELDDSLLPRIYDHYHELRRDHEPIVHKGIREILTDMQTKEIKAAVVSNNPEGDIRLLMERAGLINFFQAFVGNDQEGIKSKPEPDMYLEGCRQLDTEPSRSAVVEDSLIGSVAGRKAGCYVIGVATGANSYAELVEAGTIDGAYPNFNRTLRHER